MTQVLFTTSSVQQPNYLAEPLQAHLHLLPGGANLNYAEFPNLNGLTVRATAAAVVGAEEVQVEVMSSLGMNYRIPAAASFHFGPAGDGKFATLTTEARTGDESLSVFPLIAAIAEGDEAFYGPGAYQVASGQLVGRTNAEAAAKVPYGAADVVNDDRIYLLAFTSCPDMRDDNRCTLLRPGTLIYKDRLPGWDTMLAAKKQKIEELYECILSEDA